MEHSVASFYLLSVSFTKFNGFMRGSGEPFSCSLRLLILYIFDYVYIANNPLFVSVLKRPHPFYDVFFLHTCDFDLLTKVPKVPKSFYT